ncbi:MAG: transketolase [Kiritimatiellaeota bacterium]|nr:transketolase [Kiritimatiellota bacterium]
MMTIPALKEKARWVRQQILEMALHAKSGHVTSSFSCTEILVALYHGGVLRVDPKNPDWPERDIFLMSKGQSGIGLYPILADLGFFPLDDLNNFAGKGSHISVHIGKDIPGSEIVSGSLGHGLGIACGWALADRMDFTNRLIVTLLGDAECYEGSVWEAAMFAGHHRLNNMVAIIDRNEMGVLDFTECSLKLNPLDEKFRAFGWDVKTIDGHSFEAIFSALHDVRSRRTEKPLMIIANTVKGKGVSFMENVRFWHYRVPEGDLIEAARKELAQG